MTPEDLRRLMSYLEERVQLTTDSKVRFEIPGESQMLADGIHPEAIAQLLAAPWLEEMVVDVRETPDFCEPDETPEQILRLARDVVQEYIRKRFSL
jgi:hypothetical protein